MADEEKKPKGIMDAGSGLGLSSEGLANLIKAIYPKGIPSSGGLGGLADQLKEAGEKNPYSEALSSIYSTLMRQQAQKDAAVSGNVNNALANQWFAEHWPQPRTCTVCRHAEWGLVPQFAHVALGPIGALMRTRTYPCVAVTCRTCGNTLFFNAVSMGLLPKGED
jgi:hypothetical protein